MEAEIQVTDDGGLEWSGNSGDPRKWSYLNKILKEGRSKRLNVLNVDVSKREDSIMDHGVLVSNWVNTGKEKDRRHLL